LKLLAEAFPNRTHVVETDRYFTKGLEGSAPTLSEGNRMPTMQNLSEVQRKCGVSGRIELHEQESTMNKNKSPVEGGGRAPEERGGRMASLP